MNPRLAALTAATIGVACIVVVPPHTHAAPPTPLTLVSQADGFNVAANGVFSIIVEVPGSLPLDSLAGADITVTAYGQVADTDDVTAALDGDLQRSIDAVDVPLTDAGRPQAQQLAINVPTETSTRTAPALQLSRAGLYPVIIEIRMNGEVVAEMLTFIHRLPAPGEDQPADLGVALVVATTQPVQLGDANAVQVDEASRAELTRLADVLDASAMPVTVRLTPQVLQAVDVVDPALADRLIGLLQANDVLSAPELPLDASAAAAAEQGPLYAQWLRDGEDLLAQEASIRAVRTIAFVDQPLSTAGGAMLRDLGTRLLVFTPAVYDTTPDSLGGFTDTTQLVRVDLGGSALLDAAIIDRRFTDVLAKPSTDPALTAVYTVTKLLATAQGIVDTGGDPSRHSVVMGATGLGLPDTAVLASVSTLLAATPGLLPVTVDEASSRTDTLLLDGVEVRVGLPASTKADITDRIRTANALTFDLTTTGSMLPSDDPRPAAWSDTIGILPTSALSDPDVAGIAAGLTDEFAAIRASVEAPPPFSFVLTGQSSMIRLRFHNNGPTELTVRLRMASAKLVFPLGDQFAVLAPNTVTEVEIPVETRANGRFPVSLEVFTPVGDIAIVPPVPLTAQVNALSGLGNLITGALVLVLVTWWAHHVLAGRRRRHASAAAQRHPVAAGSGTGDDAALRSELSPDAATSTLPPS